MVNLTAEQKADIGARWAKFLKLKISKDHPDRFDLDGGDKTPLGVYYTVRRLVEEHGEGGLL